MFLDLQSGGGGNGTSCTSCKQPIWPGEASRRIHFTLGNEHGLDRLNGLYHAACAAPFQSVIRALGALRHIAR